MPTCGSDNIARQGKTCVGVFLTLVFATSASETPASHLSFVSHHTEPDIGAALPF